MKLIARIWPPIPTRSMNGDFSHQNCQQSSRSRTRGLDMGGDVKSSLESPEMGKTTNLAHATR